MPFTVARDIISPTVVVQAVADGAVIAVSWAGTTDGGSGVAWYDLDVSVGGGPWQPLLAQTTDTSYRYVGENEQSYTFRVTATDNVGNADRGETSVETLSGVTKYYYFGGQRVAMRDPDNAVIFLHSDHLGSTSLRTDSSGQAVGRQGYYPFGAVRWVTGTLGTDFGFTGQRADAYINLHLMGARWYDSRIGRWISADTIVPDPANPQSLNRYSYVYNNLLRYTDPSGHYPLDEEWERTFREENGRDPTDLDRQNCLFSLIFPGSGPNGAWTDEDWAYLAAHRKGLFAGRTPWRNAGEDEDIGLSRFIQHTERLVSFYGWNEADQFVRAYGLLFAGIPYDKPLAQAAWDSRHGPSLPFLKEGTEGFARGLVEVGDDPAHHYAGQLWLGYFYGPGVGISINIARDIDTFNWPDIQLGNIAVGHAFAINTFSLRIPFTGIGLVGVPHRHLLLPSLMRLELGN